MWTNRMKSQNSFRRMAPALWKQTLGAISSSRRYTRMVLCRQHFLSVGGSNGLVLRNHPRRFLSSLTSSSSPSSSTLPLSDTTYSEYATIDQQLQAKVDSKQVEELLSKPHFTPNEIASAAQTVRSLTHVTRQLLQREGQPATCTAVQGVQSMLKLLETINTSIQASPNEYLQHNSLTHWYNGNCPQSTHLLNAVLDVWSLCWNQGHGNNNNGLPTPAQLLDQFRQSPVWEATPKNARTYSILLHACNNGTNSSLWNEKEQHPSGIAPDELPLVCESVIQELLDAGTTDSSSDDWAADEFVEKTDDTSTVHHHPPSRAHKNKVSNEFFLPDCYLYTIALKAWVDSGTKECGTRANQLFTEYVELCNSNVLTSTPTTVTYNTVLEALVQSEEKASIEMADSLFLEMELAPFPGVSRNGVGYRLMCVAWADLYWKQKQDPERTKLEFPSIHRAVALVHENIRKYADGKKVELDPRMFGKLIAVLTHTHAKPPTDEDLEKEIGMADNLYSDLVNEYQRTGDPCYLPDNRATRTMVTVYAQSSHPDKATQVLHRLEEAAASQNDSSILASPTQYMDVALSWYRRGKRLVRQDDFVAAGECADQLDRLVHKMIHLSMQLKDDRYLPRMAHIGNCIDMYSKAKEPLRARAVFREMHRYHQETGNDRFRPTAHVYRKLMYSYAVHTGKPFLPSAGQKAEDLLEEMERLYANGDESLKPTRKAYRDVIVAWSGSGVSNADVRCENVFDRARHSFQNGNADARPDAELYGAVISLYSGGNDKKAEEYLNLMIEDYLQNDNKDAKPTVETFNMVLTSCVHSDDPRACQRAVGVFQTLRQLILDGHIDARPNRKTLQLVTQALSCSTSIVLLNERGTIEKQFDELTQGSSLN